VNRSSKIPNSHFKIHGARRATWSKVHTEDPKITGPTIKNSDSRTVWRLGFVHPWKWGRRWDLWWLNWNTNRLFLGRTRKNHKSCPRRHTSWNFNPRLTLLSPYPSKKMECRRSISDSNIGHIYGKSGLDVNLNSLITLRFIPLRCRCIGVQPVTDEGVLSMDNTPQGNRVWYWFMITSLVTSDNIYNRSWNTNVYLNF